MSRQTVELIVSIVGGVLAVVLVRWALHRFYVGWELRQQDKDPTDVARRRTTWLFAQRVIVALVTAIAVWIVLAQFEATQTVAQALLASSAVVAIFAGLAFNVPLSNLGSGMLVAFAQPLRLGDRVTVGEHTGFVEQMSLLYTTLATDDARRVAIPNSQLTSTVIVNRTIRDPRRAVNVGVSVPVGADLDRSIAVVSEAAGRVGGLQGVARVLVGDVGDTRVRLDVLAYGPLDADVAALQSELRRASLAALADAGQLAH